MEYIEANQIPDLTGTDVMSARAWIKEVFLAGVTPGHHADDTIEADCEMDNGKALTTEAAKKLNKARLALCKASASWIDPEFIYSLFGEMKFMVEERYPGFIMDVAIIDASRTGYVSPPGQEHPTILVENVSRFFAIQIFPIGKLSDATKITIMPTEGVEFGGPEYIDYSDMELVHKEAITVDSWMGIESAIEDLSDKAMSSPNF